MTTAPTSATEKIRVLVIDDDQGDFLMAQAVIGSIDHPDQEYEVEWVSSFPEALDAFDANEHDVYLVDYFLEDHDGLELVREARRRGMREPLIMLTGRGSREVDVEAMKAGASDYLVKGRLDPNLMERSIRYALERQRAEAALRDSEERHRSLFDHLPIGLYRVSPEGEFMDANPALVRILGYPPPPTLRERYAPTLYVAPKDRQRFRDLLESQGVARGFETKLELEDGTTVRVRNTARTHRTPDGEIQYLEGALEDVTDLQRTAEMRGDAERFEAVYTRSKLALVLVDLAGTVAEGNTAFLRTFGYTNDQLRGKALTELAAPSDRDELDGDVAALTKGSVREVDVERRLVSEDGAVLWARITGTLITDGNGEPDHVLLMLQDVAETGEMV